MNNDHSVNDAVHPFCGGKITFLLAHRNVKSHQKFIVCYVVWMYVWGCDSIISRELDEERQRQVLNLVKHLWDWNKRMAIQRIQNWVAWQWHWLAGWVDCTRPHPFNVDISNIFGRIHWNYIYRKFFRLEFVDSYNNQWHRQLFTINQMCNGLNQTEVFREIRNYLVVCLISVLSTYYIQNRLRCIRNMCVCAECCGEMRTNMERW